MLDSRSDEWILQHEGESVHHLGAVTPPIFQTSTFVHESVAAWQAVTDPADPLAPYVYSRLTNPTLAVVEAKLAALEGTESARLVGSGMAAMSSAILHCVNAGDHIVSIDTGYGPTMRFLKEYLGTKFGITTTFVDGSNTEAILAAVQPNTRLIYLETPSSLFFQVQNIPRITAFARQRGILTMIDSTFSAGIRWKPAALGVDLVCHTASKFFGGHSDVVGGVIAGSRAHLDAILVNEIELLGNIMSPFVGWLVLRGMRTLKVRLEHHAQTATEVASWLGTRPEIDQVIHVGSPSHPQAALAQQLGLQPGALISFTVHQTDRAKVHAFVDRLKVFQIGVSWGGFESLAVTMTAQPMAWSEPRELVRIYCGLESAQDLISDLNQALVALA
ncbi:MAG: aminotransferase class I/II-fold pyridoxal phosphate-dependent enzyme [Chthonomonas sp.]|nr:aminotransferase class I/II-fold pyridoxal phosphate-dependent enzyme [Chthonomonas sp.]